jgi:hypothetical protein
MPDVHNHGPNDGPGLDCGETRLGNGQLLGNCFLREIPIVQELEQRVAALENREQPVKLLPQHNYRATVVAVERKRTQLGRWYWKIQFEIDGQPGRFVWDNRVESQPSPIEQAAKAVGVNLDRHTEAPMRWRNGLDPTRMVGKKCIIDVGIQDLRGERFNHVRHIYPPYEGTSAL